MAQICWLLRLFFINLKPPQPSANVWAFGHGSCAPICHAGMVFFEFLPYPDNVGAVPSFAYFYPLTDPCFFVCLCLISISDVRYLKKFYIQLCVVDQ